MKSNPLVSVLMTVYNREKFIAEAIESVIASTYQNWELIIVDDQSQDGSVEIAKSYVEGDKRIRVYVNDHNLGDYPNRNRAASYAKGKYLKYVDADDMIYPYGLEQLVYYMEQYPDAAYALCSLEQEDDRIYPIILNNTETYRWNYFHKSIFHKAPLSSIIKREAFEAIGGFSGKQHLGDFELWHMLSFKSSVLLLPGGIVWSREHDDQQMNDNLTNPFVPFKYLLIGQKLVASNECPLTDKEKLSILKNYNKKKSNAVISALKNHSLKKGFELYKSSNLSSLQVFYYFFTK